MATKDILRLAILVLFAAFALHSWFRSRSARARPDPQKAKDSNA